MLAPALPLGAGQSQREDLAALARPIEAGRPLTLGAIEVFAGFPIRRSIWAYATAEVSGRIRERASRACLE